MPTNDIDFNGKTIRAAILAADNTLVGDIAKDSTLDTIAEQQEVITELQNTVKYFANILAQLGFTVDPASGRMRITVEAGTLPTVTTVTTVSTVTNIAQFGAISTAGTVFDLMQNTWANNIRGRIA